MENYDSWKLDTPEQGEKWRKGTILRKKRRRNRTKKLKLKLK